MTLSSRCPFRTSELHKALESYIASIARSLVPGLVGIVSRRGAAEAQRRFSLGSRRMLRHAGLVAESVWALEDTCLLGHVHLDSGPAQPDEDRSPRATRDRTTPDVGALFHGVL